jgi:hypothetical protein
VRRALIWFASMGAFLTALWFGTVEGNQGAANLAVFYAWFVFCVSLFAASDDVAREVQAKGKPPVPMWIDTSADLAALGLMLWHGWMLTAAVFVVHMMFMNHLWRELPPKKGAT